MTVTMSSVWDRTSEVIAGRAGILASIAVATLWLPVVIGQVIAGAITGGPPATGGAGGVTMILTLLIAVIGYWGKLAIVAVASDPAFTAGDAYRAAARRLPLLIGLLLVAGAVVLSLAMPAAIAAGPVAAQVRGFGTPQFSASLAALPPGRAAFLSVYLLALAILLAWAGVRLAAINPVVLNEREGLASFPRSFEVTHGHFWRLLGVFLLFGVVMLVASIAAKSITGILARLILGPDHPLAVAFVVIVFTAAVAAAGSVVAGVFVTRFYLSRTDPKPAL